MNDPIDPRRRRVLSLMGALGGGAFAARALPGFARDALAAGAATRAGAPPLLLPKNAIDVHTHFFNASDASVVGYLTHSSSHGHPRLEKFLERMEGVLLRLVRIAPRASEEYEQLQGFLAQRASLAPDAMDAVLEQRVTARRDAIAEALAREMRDSGVAAEFGEGFVTDNGFEPVPQDAGQVRALLDPDHVDGDDKGIAGRAGTTVPGVFRFLGCMLQERWMSLRTFRRGHEDRGRGVRAAFGALVDFEHWYRDPAGSPLADQMKLHSLLSEFSGGYMLPLMAYNPWSDILTKGGSLGMVRDAVENHGFIGAKIYPPVGFLPAGNTAHPRNSKWPWPDHAQLNEHLEAFFSECASLGIPVMAHANSTQGRDAEQDTYSRPEGWEALVARLAERRQVPLVDLGHFGGDGGGGGRKGKKAPANDWPVRFARLMGQSGGEGFYGDLGYWSGLRTCGTGDQACSVALDRLAAAKKAYPGIERRLMYGSDWFMMIKEIDWKRWPGDIAAGLANSGFDLDRLFHQNAVECFGLVPGGANRGRVEKFLGGTPRWLG